MPNLPLASAVTDWITAISSAVSSLGILWVAIRLREMYQSLDRAKIDDRVYDWFLLKGAGVSATAEDVAVDEPLTLGDVTESLRRLNHAGKLEFVGVGRFTIPLSSSRRNSR